jgi:hypothetical protein
MSQTWKTHPENQMKGTIQMKTQITLTKFLSALALAAILSVCTAHSAQANVDIYSPVGITFGQTVRGTAANTGTRAIIVDWTVLDSEGAVLGQLDRQVIEPGKMMSFDLNADDIVRESNRIQIRVVISGDTSRGLLTSIEVFENATGKTTVFIGDPGI